MPASRAAATGPLSDRVESARRRVQEFFDRVSRVYDNPLVQAAYYRRVQRKTLEAAARRAPAAQAVLDVGTGTGELFRLLSERYPDAKLVGLDLSGEMLEKARAKDFGGAQVAFVQGSVYELPFGDNAFDLITNTISSHFYLDFDRALSEIRRVLAPGGHLLMASLSNGPLARFPNPWQDELVGLHARFRSPGHQIRQMARAGLNVVRVERLVRPTHLFVAKG